MDITICSPLIIIPDLKRAGTYFKLDLGTVDVSSELKVVDNRWIHFPKKKTVIENVIIVTNNQLRFDFVGKNGEDNIFNEEEMKIKIAMVNPSPYLEEESKADTGIERFPIFDLG